MISAVSYCASRPPPTTCPSSSTTEGEHRNGPPTQGIAPLKKTIYSLIDLHEILVEAATGAISLTCPRWTTSPPVCAPSAAWASRTRWMARPSRGSTSSNQATVLCCMPAKSASTSLASAQAELLPNLKCSRPLGCHDNYAGCSTSGVIKRIKEHVSLLPDLKPVALPPPQPSGSKQATIVPAMILMQDFCADLTEVGRLETKGVGAAAGQLARVLRGGREAAASPQIPVGGRRQRAMRGRRGDRRRGSQSQTRERQRRLSLPARVGAVYPSRIPKEWRPRTIVPPITPSPAGARIPAPMDGSQGCRHYADVGPRSPEEEEARVEAALDQVRDQFREKDWYLNPFPPPKEEGRLMPDGQIRAAGRPPILWIALGRQEGWQDGVVEHRRARYFRGLPGTRCGSGTRTSKTGAIPCRCSSPTPRR